MKIESKLKVIVYSLIFMLLNSHFSYAQKKQKIKKHELTLNIANLVIGFPKVSYSYLINNESTIGISGGFSFDNDNEYKFQLIPNYRVFFGKKTAAGFFIEANGAFFSQYEQQSTFFGGTINANNRKHLGLGLGLAIGGKFLSKKGFVGELFIGSGRNFINTDIIDDFYPRFGISVGKRF